jgi:hypothetical protein
MKVCAAHRDVLHVTCGQTGGSEHVTCGQTQGSEHFTCGQTGGSEHVTCGQTGGSEHVTCGQTGGSEHVTCGQIQGSEHVTCGHTWRSEQHHFCNFSLQLRMEQDSKHGANVIFLVLCFCCDTDLWLYKFVARTWWSCHVINNTTPTNSLQFLSTHDFELLAWYVIFFLQFKWADCRCQ